jgi:hypothetical protein
MIFSPDSPDHVTENQEVSIVFDTPISVALKFGSAGSNRHAIQHPAVIGLGRQRHAQLRGRQYSAFSGGAGNPRNRSMAAI